VVVLVVIFVLTAYAGTNREPSPPPARSGGLSAGACVNVASGPITSVVPCSGPHQLRIVSRVDEMTACPEAAERRRLGTDGLIDCVVSE